MTVSGPVGSVPGQPIVCRGCGTVTGSFGNETPIPERCGHCPPWTCGDCGQPDSHAVPCGCWLSLEGLPLADLKALFARIDLSLETP